MTPEALLKLTFTVTLQTFYSPGPAGTQAEDLRYLKSKAQGLLPETHWLSNM